MRYLRYACIAAFAVALIVVALANRGIVTLRALPSEMSDWGLGNFTVELPLFIVIFCGIIVGLLVGFVWEWMREYSIRSEASTRAREVRRLEREIARLKGEKNAGKDDVLALLDEAG